MMSDKITVDEYIENYCVTEREINEAKQVAQEHPNFDFGKAAKGGITPHDWIVRTPLIEEIKSIRTAYDEKLNKVLSEVTELRKTNSSKDLKQLDAELRRKGAEWREAVKVEDTERENILYAEINELNEQKKKYETKEQAATSTDLENDPYHRSVVEAIGLIYDKFPTANPKHPDFDKDLSEVLTKKVQELYAGQADKTVVATELAILSMEYKTKKQLKKAEVDEDEDDEKPETTRRRESSGLPPANPARSASKISLKDIMSDAVSAAVLNDRSITRYMKKQEKSQ